MTAQQKIATLTLWVNRSIAAGMVVLLFTLERIISWYCTIRQLLPEEQLAITIAFYCCSVVVLFALWNMDRLLTAILRNEIFTRGNVRRLRRVQWCCGLVSLICIPATVAYMPLIFMVIVMAFLFLCICVVSCVMDAAVTLREENDLTI